MNVVTTNDKYILINVRKYTYDVQVTLVNESTDEEVTFDSVLVPVTNYEKLYLVLDATQYVERVTNDGGTVEYIDNIPEYIPMVLSGETTYYIEVTDTNDELLYKGKVFCTNQATTNHSMNNNDTYITPDLDDDVYVYPDV